MNILFVCSGHRKQGPNVVVSNQLASLREVGLNVEVFAIAGRGAVGYLRAVPRLRALLKKERFDVVHAHYSMSAYVASLAGAHPLVVSLMGSDTMTGRIGRVALRLFRRFSWEATIVKSARMADELGLKNVHVVPNGVSLARFEPIPREQALSTVGFRADRRHIVFVADPSRSSKDFPLAQAAVELVGTPDVELHAIFDTPHESIPAFLWAADALLLTSRHEGSPNVVKEAMAACLPVVSTDVGDVREIVGATEGCSVVEGRDPARIAAALDRALGLGHRTDGRSRVAALDAPRVAVRLSQIYDAAAGLGASPDDSSPSA